MPSSLINGYVVPAKSDWYGARVCPGTPPELEPPRPRCLRHRFCHLPWRSSQLRNRSEEHTSELQSPYDLVCRLLLEKKKKKRKYQEPRVLPQSIRRNR